MGNYRKKTAFPLYDTKLSPDAEKGQILIGHGMEKRQAVIVATLPNWGQKGVTVKLLREHLNRTLRANLNANHVRYALESLVAGKVISKREAGDDTVYYATATTAARFAKYRVIRRGK